MLLNKRSRIVHRQSEPDRDNSGRTVLHGFPSTAQHEYIAAAIAAFALAAPLVAARCPSVTRRYRWPTLSSDTRSNGPEYPAVLRHIAVLPIASLALYGCCAARCIQKAPGNPRNGRIARNICWKRTGAGTQRVQRCLLAQHSKQCEEQGATACRRIGI